MTWSVANWLVAAVVLATHAWLGLQAAQLKRRPGTTVSVLALLGLGSFLTIGFEGVLPEAIAVPLIQVAYTWVNLLGLFVGLFVYFQFDARLWHGLLPAWQRQRESAYTALIFSGVVGVVAVASAMLSPKVVEVNVRLEHVTAPLRIVQISDLHLGVFGQNQATLESVIGEVEALEPDVVVITGDTVDGTVDELWRTTAPLATLAHRVPTYMVLGNHENRWGQEEWAKEFQRLGVRVLRNDAVWLHEQAIWLAGVDDIDSPTYDLDLALDEVDPSVATILLAHQPRVVTEAARYGVDLVLAGHTHGGQIFPFGWTLAWVKQSGYVSGRYRRDDTLLYVNSGTGWGGAPLRLGTRAEITLLHVRGYD